jgi:hypothetical protein
MIAHRSVVRPRLDRQSSWLVAAWCPSSQAHSPFSDAAAVFVVLSENGEKSPALSVTLPS